MKENKFIEKAFAISKLRGMEEVIQTNFRIPNVVRKLYCMLGNIQVLKSNQKYIKYEKAIKELHNKYLGERCFIVGMGPSLNSTNFELIKDEILFVTNRFFAGNFKVKPKYWCVSDIGVFYEYNNRLLELDTTLFLAEEAVKLFVEKMQQNVEKEPIVIRSMGNVSTWKKFSKDLTRGSYGGNVIFSCLQIAWYMGFREVYLLGCDCDHTKGIHFDNDEKIDDDDVWKDTLDAYLLSKKIFEDDERKIYNSTVGGKLEIFERVDLEDINE